MSIHKPRNYLSKNGESPFRDTYRNTISQIMGSDIKYKPIEHFLE